MDTIDLNYAREHLSELIERAANGEDVRIADPKYGLVRLTPVAAGGAKSRPRRISGRLAGTLAVPTNLLEPMSDEELKLWYGEDA